jgi:hypothetical protein
MIDKHKPRLPGYVLTVVIRDDSPMVFCNDLPAYRSVRVQLTGEQRKMLALQYTGSSGTSDFYETISHCFIEPPEEVEGC